MRIPAETAFTILAFPNPADAPIVVLGYPTGMVQIDDPAETGQYHAHFRRLQAAALAADDTRTFVTSLAGDL